MTASPLRPLLPEGFTRPTRLPLLSVTLGLVLLAVVTAGIAFLRPGEFQSKTCELLRRARAAPKSLWAAP